MIEETTLNALRLNVGLATHPKTGEVWIGNKKRTVFEVTDQWIYYRVTGNGRTKRCRKATWRTWRIKYAAYVANVELSGRANDL